MTLLPCRGSSAGIVLLLIGALVGIGLEIHPAPSSECSIATDDHTPNPQPREESSDESAEDEETESAKHAALGSTSSLDGSPPRAGVLRDHPLRIALANCGGIAPIRGPPRLA